MKKSFFDYGVELFVGAFVPTVVLLWLSSRRVRVVFSLSHLLFFKIIVLLEGIVVILTIIFIWLFMLSEPKQINWTKAGIMGVMMGFLGAMGATLTIMARHYYPLTWRAVIDADWDRLFFAAMSIPILLRYRYIDALLSRTVKDYNRFRKVIGIALICGVLGFLVSILPPIFH